MRIWLIAGPTASGKSALAFDLARAEGGEIVNADSMQLYTGLAVLTARPCAEEARIVPHHLYGVADAAQAWSAGRWLRSALEIIADIGGRGRPAIVVGGSGLYLKVLASGLAPVPEIPMPVRREARGLFERLGEAAFRARLAKLDERAEAAIGPGDKQRLTRAFEVFLATGRALSDWKEETAPALSLDALRAVALAPERSELVRRCEARVETMIADGALDEVRRLLARRLDPELPAMKALGLRAFAAHLSGEISLAEAVVRAKAETRRFAKRQTTWLRHQAPNWPRIDPACADLLAAARTYLTAE